MNRWIAIVGMLAFFLTGCARIIIPSTPNRPAPAPRESESIPSATATPTIPPVETPDPKPTPRALVALELTEQGRILIERKRPDAAIRALERAMNLYPKNGKIYYYLAEAWLQKGNREQAAEFNQLARIYLRKDPNWVSQVKRQQIRIQGQ